MMTPSDGQQEQSLTSKKMRMTLACVRCRSKKVKCDTAHPSCDRCSQAKVSCSYEGTSTQVDLFNIVKLNDIVDTLQQRVQSLESTVGDIHQTTRVVTNNLNGNDPAATTTDRQVSTVSTSSLTPNTHHAHEWTLSLTPTGLRIDTNIATPPNLYKILLSGISQLDLDQDDTVYNGDSAGCLTCASGAPLPDLHHQPAIVTRKAPLWRSNFTSFPLYNAWPPNSSPKSHGHMLTSPERPHNSHHTCHDQHNHHRHHHYQSHAALSTSSSKSMFILDDMIDIYNECFLGLPDTDYEGTIGERYHQGRLDPLLANAIFAWSARHGAIYHNLFPGQDPNDVGECYFDAAKELLKDRFMIPTMDTLHSLLVMYIYAIGRPPDDNDDNQQQQHQNSVESEAYIFLGLAIRMCLDLKLHTEQEGTRDGKITRRMMQMERYRRFFWALYFLETLCALHSDRPFSLPSEDQITVAYPDLLDNELGERRWRAEYMIKRFRITRIYRNIIQRTAQDKLLLSSISELDSSLCQWYDQLPPHLQYSQGDHLRRNWHSNSFREQACIKLNFEYHFQRSQLYAVFMKTQQQPDGNKAADDDGDTLAASSTMERMAKEVCLTSATMTAELMTCWKQLRQRWCHFSLESMMMAVNVFEIMMKDVDHLEQARTHLSIMLDILLGSPIQHHRYVKLVIIRIQQLVYTTTSTNDAMINTNDGPIIFTGTTDSTMQDQPSQQNGYRQPIYLDNSSRYEQQYEAPGRHLSLDIYSSMQRSSGMIGTSLSDLPFSDFLYNPVMDIPSPFGPYTTATNTAIQQQPMPSAYPPPPPPPTHPVSSSSLSSLIPSQPTSMMSMNDIAAIEGTNPTVTTSISSSSLSPSSLSSSSISPRKGPTTLAPTAYQQDLHPDYSAASLWITLHQPAASNQLDSFDYTALQQPPQSTDQHYSAPQ